MSKIIDYSFASSLLLKDLPKRVREMMERGWEPFGAIVHQPEKIERWEGGGSATCEVYSQPMVKYEQNN